MVYHGYVHSSSCNETSILPTLNTINLSLAHKIHTAIITYSHSICKITKNKIAEELIKGFRLLGTPIGSTELANQFSNEQLQSITTQASLLTDQQSDLSNYSTRILSKNCHTYSAATSCNLPDNFNPKLWHSWNVPLTQGIDSLINDFLSHLTTSRIPDHTKYISHVHVNKGGLSLLYPSHLAAPDFVISMTSAIRYATTGF